jgi:hypothetical protein
MSNTGAVRRNLGIKRNIGTSILTEEAIEALYPGHIYPAS